MTQNIEKPWIICHELEEGEVETIVSGPENMDPRKLVQFSLVICDIIRTVARGFNVDEEVVWNLIEKEHTNPRVLHG